MLPLLLKKIVWIENYSRVFACVIPHRVIRSPLFEQCAPIKVQCYTAPKLSGELIQRRFPIRSRVMSVTERMTC